MAKSACLCTIFLRIAIDFNNSNDVRTSLITIWPTIHLVIWSCRYSRLFWRFTTFWCIHGVHHFDIGTNIYCSLKLSTSESVENLFWFMFFGWTQPRSSMFYEGNWKNYIQCNETLNKKIEVFSFKTLLYRLSFCQRPRQCLYKKCKRYVTAMKKSIKTIK